MAYSIAELKEQQLGLVKRINMYRALAANYETPRPDVDAVIQSATIRLEEVNNKIKELEQ